MGRIIIKWDEVFESWCYKFSDESYYTKIENLENVMKVCRTYDVTITWENVLHI